MEPIGKTNVENATVKRLPAASIVVHESLASSDEREFSANSDRNQQYDLGPCLEAGKSLRVNTELAEEVLRRRTAIFRITSGSKAFDKLLSGGFESQAVTELIGEPGSGKSQIVHTMCVLVQLPEHRGGLGDCRALFIDADGTFSPERIVQIATGHYLPCEKVLKNILVGRVNSVNYLTYVLNEALKVIPKENIKLLVLDSLSGCFQREYTETQSYTEKLQKLNGILNRLYKLSQTFNIPVLVTNQIIAASRKDCQVSFTPTNADLVGPFFSYRILLAKSKHASRIAYLFRSSPAQNHRANFKISSKGIEDLAENEIGSLDHYEARF